MYIRFINGLSMNIPQKNGIYERKNVNRTFLISHFVLVEYKMYVKLVKNGNNTGNIRLPVTTKKHVS